MKAQRWARRATTPLLARSWGNFLRSVPLFPTAVAAPFRGIGGHPVANFRTEVESVENNVRCTSWGFGNFKIRNDGHCLLKIPHTLRKLWKVPQQRSLFIGVVAIAWSKFGTPCKRWESVETWKVKGEEKRSVGVRWVENFASISPEFCFCIPFLTNPKIMIELVRVRVRY